MTFQRNHAEFRVTQTQKLIAAKALEAVTQHEVHPDDPRIDDFARTMVIIQNGQMGGYFGQGTYWSLASRSQREPVQVAQERFDIETKVDAFQQSVANARGEAARRIRENRARRLRAEIRSLIDLRDDLGQDVEELLEFNVEDRLQELWQQLLTLRLGRLG